MVLKASEKVFNNGKIIQIVGTFEMVNSCKATVLRMTIYKKFYCKKTSGNLYKNVFHRYLEGRKELHV